jgi:hypothetical protein
MLQILAQFRQQQMYERSDFSSAAIEQWGLEARWAQPVGKFFKILEDLVPLTMTLTRYVEKSGATYPATKTGMLSNRHN